MNQIRLYVDEDSFDKSLIAAFRSADLDVITVADVSKQSYSDEDQLIWAAEQERVIYSYNRRDFCRLHKEFLSVDETMQELSYYDSNVTRLDNSCEEYRH